MLSIKKEKYLFQIMGDYWNYLTSIETQFYGSSIPNIKWEFVLERQDHINNKLATVNTHHFLALI